MVSVRVGFNLKGSSKIFPQETMAAGENEKEIIKKLLKNATPGNISKATKYGVKIFQGKSLKTLFR